jgi:hypothetical protein
MKALLNEMLDEIMVQTFPYQSSGLKTASRCFDLVDA